jgi:octaprenyl-diphosphate synthase
LSNLDLQLQTEHRAGRLDRLAEPAKQDLERTETFMSELLSSTHPFLSSLAGHLERFRGKRLRPVLVHLSARAFGGEAPLAAEVAAVIELIHLATLCHDDVLDEAETRRSVPTVNARWGNRAAIITGDLLFSRALERLGRFDDPRPYRILSRAARLVCEGELLQIGARFNAGLTEEDYFDLITKKTAVLFGAATQLGALLAGATEDESQRMEAFGRGLGVAYQIVDDCMDLTGVEATAGKSLGSDLRNGELTLPVIHLLSTAGPGLREELLREFRPGGAAIDRKTLQTHLQRCGSIEYSLQIARRDLQRACESLASLPPSSAKNALVSFRDYVLERTK